MIEKFSTPPHLFYLEGPYGAVQAIDYSVFIAIFTQIYT